MAQKGNNFFIRLLFEYYVLNETRKYQQSSHDIQIILFYYTHNTTQHTNKKSTLRLENGKHFCAKIKFVLSIYAFFFLHLLFTKAHTPHLFT